jgi:hypothetical protein
VSSSSAAAASPTHIMWILYLEAGFAACLLVLIVWFTLPKNKPKPEQRVTTLDTAKDTSDESR